MNAKKLLWVFGLLVVLLGQPAQAYYNATTGRWLSRDPIEEKEEEPNLYAFVINDPVRLFDRDGRAFYAIDGTWTKASDGSNPRVLYEETKEFPKSYWRGPVDGPLGSDSGAIRRSVKRKICEDYCWYRGVYDNSMPIYLTGWSRGAVIAMGVANDLNFPGCRCDGSGPCGWLFGTRYVHIPVYWIGLFDAVRMTRSIPLSHHVPSNVLRFDHAVKTGNSEPYYLTFHFYEPTEMPFYNYDHSPTTHSDIGMSKKRGNNGSYGWIRERAKANGVAF